MSRDVAIDTPGVIFLSNKSFSNNPMLKMYTEAFLNKGKCIVSCVDAQLQQPKPYIEFVRAPRDIWIYVRRFNEKLTKYNPFKKNHPLVQKALYYLLAFAFTVNYLFLNFFHFIKLISNKNNNVVAVFAVDGEYLFAAWLASKYYKSKFYYFVYEVWPDQVHASTTIDFSDRFARTAIEKFFCRRVDKLITSHRQISKYVRRKYSLTQSITLDIPVCPDRIELDAPQVSPPLKLHYHGAYFSARGLDQLVLAFKDINNAHLYLRGVGAYEKELKKMVEVEGLDDRISFLPPLPVEQLVIGATPYDVGIILASPNTANGRFCIGFKFFEYINSGLAVLAPTSFPLKDLIDSNNCGANYGWPNAASFVNAINMLASDRNNLERMKEASVSLRNDYNSTTQKKMILDLVLSQ